MKKLPLLFALPLLVYSCSEGEPKAEETTEVAETVEMIRSDLTNEHLMGEIKSFEQMPYTPSEDGSIGEMDSCCIVIEEYDENGFMAMKPEKNMAGETTEVGVTERTETGSYSSFTRTANGTEVFKRVVYRDDEGKSVKAVDTDSTGQVTRVHTPDEMNEYEQPVKGKSFLEDSTYVGTWSWQYIDGQRVGQAWVDSAGVQWIDRVGEVNDKGWLSKAVDTRMNETGEEVTVVETYTYDSMDDMGNWTQRTELNDGKPVEVLKRSYTYYTE
jgi:hypothetical protein